MEIYTYLHNLHTYELILFLLTPLSLSRYCVDIKTWTIKIFILQQSFSNNKSVQFHQHMYFKLKLFIFKLFTESLTNCLKFIESVLQSQPIHSAEHCCKRKESAFHRRGPKVYLTNAHALILSLFLLLSAELITEL